MSIAEDIVVVQEALGTAADAGDLSGASGAFERIVMRMRALEEEIATMRDNAIEAAESRDMRDDS